MAEEVKIVSDSVKCLANKVLKNPLKVLEICLSEVVRIMNFLKLGKGQIKKICPK